MSFKKEFIEFLKINKCTNGKLKLKFVFVCSGNIIRSPYAEFIAKKIFNSKKILNIIIESGACFYQNSSLIEFTIKWLKKSGISEKEIYSHTPRLISNFEQEFADTDIFIGMTRDHLDYLNGYFPKKQSFLLKEIVLDKNEDVLDPYFEPKLENRIMMDLKELIIQFCKIIEDNS